MRDLPRAITFDFWNTLAFESKGLLSGLRRESVRAVLERHEVVLSDAALTKHLADAGALHDVAWRSGSAFKPDQAARALVRALAGPEGDWRDEVMAAYLDAGANAELSLTPDVEPTLERLTGAGVRLGIVCDVGLTGSPLLRAFLARRGVLKHFAGWAFSDEVGCFKPSPAIFAHALAELGVEHPTGCVHVGDLRRTDIAGARAAGMRTVRYRGVEDDTSNGPEGDDVIATWDELLHLLDLSTAG
jgi:HAD superfamily hydrolase (TIGR01509 family)